MALNKATDKLSSNNLFIIILLVSLIVVGITVLASKALITTIVRDTKVASAKLTADNQLKENQKSAPELVSAYQSLGPTAAVLASALPNTPDFPSIIVTLENIGKLSGVKIKSVTPRPVTSTAAPAAAPVSSTGGTTTTTTTTTEEKKATTPTAQPYTYTVALAGSYDSIQRLLKAFEVSARPVRVTSVQFSGTGSALAATMTVETYYQDKATLPFSTETIK